MAFSTIAFLIRRRDRAKKNISRYEESYPSLTERQREITALDLPELKEQLQDGRLSVVEVVEAFMAKAVEANRDTNAITEFLEDALERAQALDKVPQEERGPLHGVPISLKVLDSQKLLEL